MKERRTNVSGGGCRQELSASLALQLHGHNCLYWGQTLTMKMMQLTPAKRTYASIKDGFHGVFHLRFLYLPCLVSHCQCNKGLCCALHCANCKLICQGLLVSVMFLQGEDTTEKPPKEEAQTPESSWSEWTESYL